MFAPLVVECDDVEGYVVTADALIPCNTLLCEYVGEVDYFSKKERGNKRCRYNALHVGKLCCTAQSDSIMMLLHTKNQAQALVVDAERHANIARFIRYHNIML